MPNSMKWFTGIIQFPSRNQQCQSTEGRENIDYKNISASVVNCFSSL